MNPQKALRREIKVIWKALKRVRRTRSKLLKADDVAESAKIVAAFGADLKDVAKRMKALDATEDSPS